MHPLISVLIIAHNRKTYIHEAVDSVLNQSLNREYYEVIVIKNFNSPDIDNYLHSNNVLNIYTNAESLGGKIREGIKASHSDIISFLEDDDLWEKNRLEKVLEVFNTNDNIGYMHNNYKLINESANELNGSLFKDDYEPYIININDLSINKIRKAIKIGAFFNLSCISIRKDILINKLEGLNKTQVAVDNFMFYSALNSTYNLVISNEKLTKYRIHEDNNSISIENNLNTFINKMEYFIDENIRGYTIIATYINKPIVKKYLTARLFLSLCANGIFKHYKGEKYSEITFFKFLKTFYVLRSVDVLLIYPVYLISNWFPKLSIKIYFWHEQKRLQKLFKKAI